jgi:simple sugar transport system permease protein
MLKLKVSDRIDILPRHSFLSLVFSLATGLLAISVIFLFSGVNPLYAIAKIFSGSFGSFYGLKETVTKAIPLILIGGGLAVAFRAKFWNIGAESQLLMGAIFGTWVGLNWGPHLPWPIIVPLMFLAGFVGGALWGLIPAILKIKFSINEVISTLMLNYICNEFMKLLIVGPWRGKTKHGFPYTDDLPLSATLSVLPGSRIHYATLIVAIATVILLGIAIYKTRFGYEVRVIGENPDAARYSGIDFFKTTLIGCRHPPLFELSGIHIIRLRLHRDYRCLAGKAKSPLCYPLGAFLCRYPGGRRCHPDFPGIAGGNRTGF